VDGAGVTIHTGRAPTVAGAVSGAVTGIGGKCLDVPGEADGTPVQLWSCTGGTNQR
jgi:hypothetical protein